MVYEFGLLQCVVACPLAQTGAGLRRLNILTDTVIGSYFPHRQEERLCLHAEDVWLQCMFVDVLIHICCLW